MQPRDVNGLREVIETDGTERAIDSYLRGCPDVWSAFLESNGVGHQGGHVLSQQVIRPAVRGVAAGLIPDFLLSGRNSGGTHWFVVELKGASENIFAGSGNTLRFSAAANKGIIQLLKYLDFCAEHQATLRNSFGLEAFREPRGILLIGRQAELEHDKERQRIKRIWNSSNHLLEVRTYDSFLRSLHHKLYFNGYSETNPSLGPGDNVVCGNMAQERPPSRYRPSASSR